MGKPAACSNPRGPARQAIVLYIYSSMLIVIAYVNGNSDLSNTINIVLICSRVSFLVLLPCTFVPSLSW